MTGEVVYNTGNPVPSADAYDRHDNTRVFDSLLNGPELSVTGRTGKTLASWAGLQQQVTSFLIAQGYEATYLAYGPGVAVDRQTQLVQRDGELYRVANVMDLPLTLTGTWATDAPKLRAVGDAALRAALASPTGAEMIGYAGGPAMQTVKDRLGRVVMATDSTSLKAACDANLNVLVTPGSYPVTDLITLRDDQTVTFMPGAIVTQAGTGNAGVFHWPEGVKDALIQGPARLRGPAYGRTPVPAPSYPNSNGCIRITGTAANPVVRPRVLGVIIEGWDDYGIFSENANYYKYDVNAIRDIGRDGIRIYGGEGGTVLGNLINNISPGFGGVAPNLNVYGITFTRRADAVATPTVTNPAPKRSIAADNVIWDCRTWKALDTHGGQDLTLADNIIWNAHIGIGIDEGDTVGQTDSPPIRIKVSGNNLWRGAGNPGGAGINISSSSAGNMGEDCSLTDNTIRGFGGVGTGGINAAYQRRLQINGGHLIDCIMAGINVPGNVRMTGLRINNPTIKNVLADGATPSIAAIAIQAAETDGCVDGVTLVREGGAMAGFSLPALATGYSFNIGGEITRSGTVTLFTAGSSARVSGGSYVTAPKAYCRVTTAGALSHAYGVVSATKISTGVVELVLEFSAASTSTLHPTPSRRGTGAGFITSDVTAVNTLRVYTYNSSGAAVDQEFDLVVYGV